MYTFFDLWSVILVIIYSVTHYFLVVCLRCRIRHSNHVDECEEFFGGDCLLLKEEETSPNGLPLDFTIQ